MEDLPLLVIDHPLGGEPAERVADKAARAVAQLAALAHVDLVVTGSAD